ncbi:aminodeoxychorismate synthase component I [Pontibacillus yanchengensis]|uniref:Aminodeoxychorismate synthase component I n=1 Tax=Pontibacillus yanchengensis TaxID=462910 RepID=A0ACC7VFD8_9BACI|nr:aminodeoxychorismate synthase component I [Pontibacillus yanchengensis]MYL53681.1 aminodeoxychorismate synthase component I [Pontibacillus yanchengensis]
MNKSPFMQFEFKEEATHSLQFSNPIKEFMAFTIKDVQQCFSEIEKWIDEGYYIAGYISYEAAPAFDSSMEVNEGNQLPLAWLGVFREPDRSQMPIPEGEYQLLDWEEETGYTSYYQGIEQIKHAIEEGNTYQVNYTTRLRSTFHGDSYSFYKQLVQNQESPYSAYLQHERFSILSASPELFFQKKHNKLTTKPMKGTMKRGRSSSEDELLSEKLFHSEKDRSENLMIVDLLRNDVGRLARPGSVKVPSLFEIERYPTVLQMTSTIEAIINPAIPFFEVFKALFPCGSITGAPKIRTMQYIKQLELSPREVYCGAIGYITPERDAVFNVPIRTVWINHENNEAVYGTGGGITWDSTSEGEYEELQTKAKLLTEKRRSFELLESMLLDDGFYPLYSFHVRRLQKSAYYFGFELDLNNLTETLRNVSVQYPVNKWKIRLLLSKEGNITAEAHPLTMMNEPVLCSVSTSSINSENPFLYHKTTNREVYVDKMNEAPEGALSVLLWNEKDEATEFTIGNLVVEKEGEYVTPPVSSGLLAGTFREQLLENGLLKEEVIRIDEVYEAESIWMINGVRGWLRVNLI